MKKIIQFIKGDQTFILFLFIFSWIFTLKNKIGFASSWDDFVFHPDTSVWVFIGALFIFVFINFVKKRIDENIANAIPSFGRYLKFFGISLIIYLHVYFICIIQKLLLTGTTIITLLISISLVFFVRYFFTKKEMYCKELENTKNQILKFFLFYFIFISVIVLVTSIVKFYL